MDKRDPDTSTCVAVSHTDCFNQHTSAVVRHEVVTDEPVETACRAFVAAMIGVGFMEKTVLDWFYTIAQEKQG